MDSPVPEPQETRMARRQRRRQKWQTRLLRLLILAGLALATFTYIRRPA